MLGWFGDTLVSMLAFTAFYLWQKTVVTRRALNPVAISAYTKVLGFVLLLPLLPWETLRLPADPSVWLILPLNVLAWTFGNVLDIKSFRLAEVSDIMVIKTAEPVLCFALGLWLFSEPFGWGKGAGLALVAGGLLLLYLRRGGLDIDRGRGLQFGAVAVMSLGASCDKYLIAHFSPFLYLAMNFLLLWGPMLLVDRAAGPDFRALLRRPWRYPDVALLAALLVLGAVFFLLALRAGEFSRIMPVFTVSTLLVVAGGALFLGERDRLGRKALAALAGSVGVWLLTV